jgi:hypothetical protein
MRGDLGLTLTEVLEDSAAIYRSRFCIGGVSVEVLGGRSEDAQLIPSLERFRVGLGTPEISIRVEWVDKLAPMPGRQLFDSGTTWRVYEGEFGLQFDFNSPVFGHRPYKRLLVDRRFQRATLQMSEEAFAGFPCEPEPLEYPLDELLITHRLTQEKAIELHSCGVVRADGTGYLFAGHSGAGKSTTTRLWTEHENVEVLSDDRIIVRRADEGPGADEGSATMRMYGTPWHGDAAYASPGSAPLAGIFILEHGRGNVLTRLSPSQAVGELFARSFVPFHRHEYVDSALEFLQEVVAAVPCYRYAFEPTGGAVERILELRD